MTYEMSGKDNGYKKARKASNGGCVVLVCVISCASYLFGSCTFSHDPEKIKHMGWDNATKHCLRVGLVSIRNQIYVVLVLHRVFSEHFWRTVQNPVLIRGTRESR